MIYLDSRYVDGPLFKAWNPRKGIYSVSVARKWPVLYTDYFVYEWVETDRWDLLAARFLRNSALWWRLLDINPEIPDPLNVKPGTAIRIPNV